MPDMAQFFLGVAGIIGAIALYLLAGRGGRRRHKCPGCGVAAMRIVGVVKKEISVEDRRVPDRWSLYLCEDCGARFKEHHGTYTVATDEEWAHETVTARTPTYWGRPW
jgi:hypothetical protein